MRIEIRSTMEHPWTSVEPITIGRPPVPRGTPDLFVIVERAGAPSLRIDVYESAVVCRAFREAVAWRDFIVVGFGANVHLVAPTSRAVVTVPLATYFGHMYAVGDRLLVADAECLHCFDEAGDRLWRSEPLGIDGVLVERVDDGIVFGESEWDPPGGWRPFRVRLSSGELVR